MKKNTSKEAFYNRLQELSEIKDFKAKINDRNIGTLVDIKRNNEGIAFGIIKENHNYYIKRGGTKLNPDASDFTYIGGLENITSFQFSTLAESEKQRNFMITDMNRASGIKVNGNVSKMVLNEDIAGDEIEKSEDSLDNLEAATAAEKASPEITANDGGNMGAGDEMGAETGMGADMSDGAGDMGAGGEMGDEMPADMSGEEMPADMGGEEGAEGDDINKAIEKSIGKLTNTIRKAEMTPEQTKSYLASLVASFKDKLPEIEVEDRKEIANKILKTNTGGEQDLENSMPDEVDETAGFGDEEFTPNGSYTVSNSGGYEIMIDSSGDSAKVRDAFGSDDPKTSDWLEIEYVPNEETGESEPVIDPNGYNIPLNQVMRMNENAETCNECGGFVQYAESRGYTKESIMECGDDEMGSLISGYANAHKDGKNNGDAETVSLYTNDDVNESLVNDYGHETYVNEVLKPEIMKLSESTDEDKQLKINELNWGNLAGAVGRGVGKLAGKGAGAVAGAAKGVGNAVAGAANNVATGVGNAAKGVGNAVAGAANNVATGVGNAANAVANGAKDAYKSVEKDYRNSNQNSAVGAVAKIAQELKAKIDALNAATVKNGGKPVNYASVLHTLSNQLRVPNGETNLSKFNAQNEGELEGGNTLIKEEDDLPFKVNFKKDKYKKDDKGTLKQGFDTKEEADAYAKKMNAGVNHVYGNDATYVVAGASDGINEADDDLENIEDIDLGKEDSTEPDIDTVGDTNETEPESMFATDTQSLGAVSPSPLATVSTGAGVNVNVDAQSKTVNVTMNEGKAKKKAKVNETVEDVFKTYVQNHLLEVTGKKKARLSESAKSPQMKRLDAVINKQYAEFIKLNKK